MRNGELAQVRLLALDGAADASFVELHFRSIVAGRRTLFVDLIASEEEISCNRNCSRFDQPKVLLQGRTGRTGNNWVVADPVPKLGHGVAPGTFGGSGCDRL